MESRAHKIFISCSLGGAVGTGLAFWLPFPLWWLGTIVGGILAGLLFCIKDILFYLPTAWRMSRAQLRSTTHAFNTLQKVHSETWWLYCVGYTLILFCFLWIGGSFFIITRFPNQYFIGVIYYIIIGSQLLITILRLQRINPTTNSKLKVEACKDAVRFASPIGWFFIIITLVGLVLKGIKALPAILYWTARLVNDCARLVRLTSKSVFTYIHSHLLYGVMFYTTLGASLAFWIGASIGLSNSLQTAVFGGLISGALGVVGCELISKRILHAQPTRY